MFVVLHNELTITQQLVIPKHKETVHKAKCKNIKCPPTEDPVCVKIKNEKNKQITFIVAINKCEIQYAKCRQDRQPDYAVFLSKKDAEANDNDKERVPNFAVFVNKNGGGDNAKEEDPKIAEDKNTADLTRDDEKNEPNEEINEEDVVGDNEEAVEGDNQEAEEVDREEAMEGGDEEDVEEINQEDVEADREDAMEGGNEEAVEGDNQEDVEEDNEEAMEDDNEEAVEGDNEEAVEGENEINVEEDKVDDEQRDEEHQDKADIIGKNLLNTYDDDEPQEGGGESRDKEDNENESEKSKDISNLAADYDQITENVDFDQNEKDCPSACAARDVMVCAKCQHNIYRTFMSTCHLRLFNCKYPDESLELISRQPCMQSAPFLTDLPGAQGRISEPGDQDNVLKFIHCRDKGKLDDPRCSFDR
ncbi:uncharacterized protein DDB_G0290685-like [Vanessa atalanta]|uniref:uncharacterized protein DDB_G0290685-like n=1 Tax=Vanessa atalanta TaxID=42275 RepID=UPI001FCE000A|nr:uncharacterized protein DDB_G0290685-like [Vanessa atalanta]